MNHLTSSLPYVKDIYAEFWLEFLKYCIIGIRYSWIFMFDSTWSQVNFHFTKTLHGRESALIADLIES